MSWAKVSEPAYRQIAALLSGYNHHTLRFYLHVLLCGRSWKYDDGWVPVPQWLIHSKVRNAELRALDEAELIEIKRRYVRGRLCREYRIPVAIRRGFTRRSWENRHRPKVNPFTGKRTQARHKSKLNDRYNNPYPDLVRDAICSIKYGFFNDPAINLHLECLRATEEKAFRSAEEARERFSADSNEYRDALKKHRAILGWVDNDQRCYEHLLNQGAEAVGGGIYTYRIAYRPQGSGRISHICGGLQSCSRVMKDAAYTGLENVHNYDIKSCHPCLLAKYLDEAGLDSTWIRTYLATEGAKYIYAERAGLSVDTWKSCLCALFMGAYLPKDISHSKGDIRNELKREVGDDPDYLDAAYMRFREVVQPLYDVLQEWHIYLDTVWAPANQYGGRGGRFVRNDTGSVLNLSELTGRGKPPHKRRAKLAAFLLQGKEAAFIHSLTILSHVYGYQVIANEHDGLVTIGEIPAEAIEIVRKNRSMQYVEVDEKPFV